MIAALMPLSRQMLAAIDGNDSPRDAAGRIAYQEGREIADVGNVDQMVLRRPGRSGFQQFIELIDTAGRAGADRAGEIACARICLGPSSAAT